MPFAGCPQKLSAHHKDFLPILFVFSWGQRGQASLCRDMPLCPLGCQGHAALPTNLSFPLFFSQALGASEAPRALRPAPAF